MQATLLIYIFYTCPHPSCPAEVSGLLWGSRDPGGGGRPPVVGEPDEGAFVAGLGASEMSNDGKGCVCNFFEPFSKPTTMGVKTKSATPLSGSTAHGRFFPPWAGGGIPAMTISRIKISLKRGGQ